jgi:hypothetical protein
MSETLLTVVAAVVFIGGAFLLLWMLDRRRQAKEGQPASPAGRRLLRLLGILAIGVVVIVGVFFACTWLTVAQPTVGQISLTTVVAVVIAVGLSIGIIIHYIGLFAEIVSFIPGRTGSAEAAQEPSVMEELQPEELSAPGEDAETSVAETSVAVDHEASQKRKWVVAGNLAIVLAWIAAVFFGSSVGSYMMGAGSPFWLVGNLASILEGISRGSRYGFCCTLPVLAFGLFFLWIAGRRFILGQLRRSSFVAVIILGVIVALVGGCLTGWFGVIEWYY